MIYNSGMTQKWIWKWLPKFLSLIPSWISKNDTNETSINDVRILGVPLDPLPLFLEREGRHEETDRTGWKIWGVTEEKNGNKEEIKTLS